MRVLLVDDIFEARDDLKYSLAHYPDVVVVADVDTTDAAWGLIEQGGIDVVFLDIRFDNMPDGDRAGFDLAVSINQLHTPPLVVFFTAFPEFALEAFRFFPFSFLPRPYSGQQLEVCWFSVTWTWLSYKLRRTRSQYVKEKQVMVVRR